MNIEYQIAKTDSELGNKILILFSEKCKFQIMWNLRHLEDKINAEKNGRIIFCVDNDKQLDVLNFSEELTDEIWDIFLSIDFKSNSLLDFSLLPF